MLFKPRGWKARTSVECTLIDILQEIKSDREEQKQLLQEFVRRMTDFSGSGRRSASHSRDGSREIRCWNCGELGHVSLEDAFLGLVTTTREMETSWTWGPKFGPVLSCKARCGFPSLYQEQKNVEETYPYNLTAADQAVGIPVNNVVKKAVEDEVIARGVTGVVQMVQR